MQQIFSALDLQNQTQLTLGEADFQHLIKVLRLGVKDQFWIVDSGHATYQATIKNISQTTFQVNLVPQKRVSSELPLQVTLACALSKKDKLEWITQKATELGVTNLIFFPAHYSIMKWKANVQEKKLARLQQIALNAAQQSKRLLVPQVHYYDQLAKIAATSYSCQLVAYEEAAKKGEGAQLTTSLTSLKPQQSLIGVFGPEGGFTVEEITQLRQNNYKVCGLGPRILRAETAPLYFLSAVSYQTELSKWE
ncbi:16S rRNA (uracil(1498)-N(3))-methyltransferase [Lactobacillus sp. DCY120]|uniref:Ribosomal RNA small subunit methyltransferase E n=1 Tax=Bombilactobacillus apium TaxID=2675299 RepID=A0A850R8X8_9LACO|nr:RsmE family RNA methyltransferase [Bombilactobacillus apium]NVY95856.1 16S rRNA (uracil(1498)-N(3))-methyltransferase [Bombilactobacillus apium]